jgi:hypothetical protein
MYKNIIHWRLIPRYYRKSVSESNDTGVVYWYFGLETIFILVMGLVLYCTTIKDAGLRKSEQDSQLEALKRNISSSIQFSDSQNSGSNISATKE